MCAASTLFQSSWLSEHACVLTKHLHRPQSTLISVGLNPQAEIAVEWVVTF